MDNNRQIPKYANAASDTDFDFKSCSVDSDCPSLTSGPGKCVGRRNLNCGAKSSEPLILK